MSDPTLPSEDDLDDARAETRLDSLSIMEAVEDDPAPDLSFGPPHPHVKILADRFITRMTAALDLPDDTRAAFELGYSTAIHDLREATSESTFSVQVVEVSAAATLAAWQAHCERIHGVLPPHDSLDSLMAWHDDRHDKGEADHSHGNVDHATGGE